MPIRLGRATLAVAVTTILTLAAPASIAAAAPDTATVTGTLTLTTAHPTVGAPLSFHYTTDTPMAMNWIGVYNDPADGPTDQQYHRGSTVWTYVQGTEGTVSLPSDALTPGHPISAYLLYNDGYTWLAQPITFTLGEENVAGYDPTPTTSHFVVDDVTEAATPPATPLRVPISGLWFGVDGAAPATPATFSKTGGADWLSVSADGVITGTTPAEASASDPAALISVTATDAAGATDALTVEFPVSAPGASPALKAATLSMWDAGAHVDNPREKLVASILRNRLDAVGLNDTGGTEATTIASLLGWDAVETATGQALISRYPLQQHTVPEGVPAVSATASVAGRAVQLWSAGLDTADAGPARACTGAADVVSHEKTTARYRQAVALANAIASGRTQDAPVVLLAALASPGTSDWTDATSARHCDRGALGWPVPQAIAAAGLADTFRTLHPDAASDPGQTTSIFPTMTGPSAERVDAVFAAGALTATESHTLVDGFPKGPDGTQPNRWISNRAAVVTSFVIGTPTGGGDGPGTGGGTGTGGTDTTSSTSGGGTLALTGGGALITLALIALVALVALVGGGILIIRRRSKTPAAPAAHTPEDAL